MHNVITHMESRCKCYLFTTPKGLVLTDPSVLCAVYLKVGYWEVFRSGRSESVPSTAFGEVIDDDGVKLTAGPFEELALKQLTAWIDTFALSYLRANPAK